MAAGSDIGECVCSLEELKLGGRKTVVLQGREVVLFYYRGKCYALDRQCYHAGGPLQEGSIKDIEERPCVQCPWHKYIICLDNGESLYQHIDPRYLDKSPEWKSKGLKQRTHTVTVYNNQVYLQLSDTASVPYDSDYYSSDEYRQIMSNVKRK